MSTNFVICYFFLFLYFFNTLFLFPRLRRVRSPPREFYFKYSTIFGRMPGIEPELLRPQPGVICYSHHSIGCSSPITRIRCACCAIFIFMSRFCAFWFGEVVILPVTLIMQKEALYCGIREGDNLFLFHTNSHYHSAEWSNYS